MVLTLQYISDDSDSTKEVFEIIRGIGSKKVCYVTLSKSCRAMQDIFKAEDLNSDGIRYIDGISSVISEPKAVENCSYVQAPYDLKPIAVEIKKAIEVGASVVIFDSLSNLLSYGPAVPAGLDILIDFIKSFLEELKSKNGEAIFLCKKKDEHNFLIEETAHFFDKVVNS
jgi:hypothetical protein